MPPQVQKLTVTTQSAHTSRRTDPVTDATPYPSESGTGVHAPIIKLTAPEKMPSQLGVAYVVTTTYGTVGSGAGVGAIARNDPILSGELEQTPMEADTLAPATAA